MSGATVTATKKLLDYLPAIYHGPDEEGQASFLEVYLRAFERILFGGVELRNDDSAEDSGEDIGDGLEEEIVKLPLLFDPWQTPEEFLPWLAGWAALTFDPSLSTERRRNLLGRIIPLYRIRGTKKYIEDVLALCLNTFVSITDGDIPALEVGRHSTVGLDTYLDGGPPHHFSVRLIAPSLNEHDKEVQRALAHSLLSFAKPAHTFYDLTLISPRMQVGVQSTVGVDTVLLPF